MTEGLPHKRRARRRLSREQYNFERLVAEALDSLPERFRRRLSNVDVVVEDEPTPEQQAASGVPADETLFGLYEGLPLTARTSGYSMVLPDKITIFRGPLERYCRTRREMRAEVRQTVMHELAHHFGIDDERLDDLGL
ncbi:MAG: metallopeptidase family protein [Chloroflexota bacterium]